MIYFLDVHYSKVKLILLVFLSTSSDPNNVKQIIQSLFCSKGVSFNNLIKVSFIEEIVTCIYNYINFGHIIP